MKHLSSSGGGEHRFTRTTSQHLKLTERWVHGYWRSGTIFLGRRLLYGSPDDVVKTIVHETIHMALHNIGEVEDKVHLGFHEILPRVFPELIHVPCDLRLSQRIELLLTELWNWTGGWQRSVAGILCWISPDREEELD